MSEEAVNSQNIFLANGLKPLRLAIQNGVGGTECANSEKWRRWRQKFEIYWEANDLEKLPQKKQIAIFLNAIGDDGLEIYDSFNVQRSTETLESILEKFEAKFNACKNTTVERYNFFTKIQKEETLDEYVTHLNNLAASCKFESLKESLVKDMFIIGIRNEKIKERLLQNDNIKNVDEAVSIAKTIELSNQRSRQLGDQEEATQVQVITNNRRQHQSRARHSSRPSFRSSSRSTSRPNQHHRPAAGSSTKANDASKTTCRKCGQIHRYKCPAQGKNCVICKKPGHFAQYCFYKNKNDK